MPAISDNDKSIILAADKTPCAAPRYVVQLPPNLAEVDPDLTGWFAIFFASLFIGFDIPIITNQEWHKMSLLIKPKNQILLIWRILSK